MKSPLDISVSYYMNYQDNKGGITPLMRFLKSDRHADKVNHIQQIEDKQERDQIKATLPAITPSGTFSTRKESGLIEHSGLLQFDIDFQDNSHITNYGELKTQLCNIENVAYCGLSVSGKGYWGLIPIKHPERHKDHFRALKKQFEQIGLTIDEKPSNVAALRGYSYDPESYFNHAAVPFTLLDKPEPRKIERKHFDNDSRSDVEQLIEKIQANRIDITTGYDAWLKIGFALAEEFGESGRDYFHAVSQFHSDYNERETDRQFNHCLKARGSGVTISSFFYLCKEYGIVLKTDKAKPLPQWR
ncbi:MAG: PriCT-2 domain-containing protein [Balneolaceae bacterium]|nr:PriCT-2 domain-containing protein [Balneolaceae bacterium]